MSLSSIECVTKQIYVNNKLSNDEPVQYLNK